MTIGILYCIGQFIVIPTNWNNLELGKWLCCLRVWYDIKSNYEKEIKKLLGIWYIVPPLLEHYALCDIIGMHSFSSYKLSIILLSLLCIFLLSLFLFSLICRHDVARYIGASLPASRR